MLVLPDSPWKRSALPLIAFLLTFSGLSNLSGGNSKTAREDSGSKFPLSKTLHRADLTDEDKAYYGPKKSPMSVLTLGAASESFLATTLATPSRDEHYIYLSLASLEKYFSRRGDNSR